MSVRIPRLLFPAAALLLLAACSGDDAAPQAGGPPGGMQLPVEAVTVKAEPLARDLSTVGTLRADESVAVRPEIAGRLARVHFEEGQRVERGDTLFTLDDSVARAALAEAQANLDNAHRANERAVDLGARQLLSTSDVDSARAQLGVSQARVASARAQLDKTVLKAPFDGVVGLREVSPGAYVSAGQALVNLVRLDPMEVDFSLPESQLAQVAAGQSVQVQVDAFPGQTFHGVVTAIEPVVDANSRSARLRAQVPNPDLRLHPGLFARVALVVGGGDETALLVPEQALMQDGEQRYVYTVVDGKAVRQPVRTGRRLPGRVEVVEGLSDGDLVITAGQAKPMMHEGMGVMVVPTEGQASAPEPAAPAGDAAKAG